MATRAANKRLTREYKSISANPPPYIQAHPSEDNILEWHYIITGPPDTPYENGQYWGTLVFPPDYPFKPPAIRMITPSGRFQTSTRLCLSISDFHPKSFNPAWEVSTILIGLLSFMTSEEMTTGSISASPAERKLLAQRSRWWNCTGGGSGAKGQDGSIILIATITNHGRKLGLGDGGKRFKEEFPELYEQNWIWVLSKNIDPATGTPKAATSAAAASEVPSAGVIKRRTNLVASGSPQQAGAVAVLRGESWVRRNKVWVGLVLVVGYVLLARALE